MKLPWIISTDGRTGRLQYWAVVGVTAAIASVLFYFRVDDLGRFSKIMLRNGWTALLWVILLIAFWAPAFAVSIRRLHDVGLHGLWLAGLGIGGRFAMLFVDILGGRRHTQEIAAMIVFAVFFLVIGSLKGEAEANAYGPAPG